MAATATRSLVEAPRTPVITDAVRKQLEQERLRMLADPSATLTPADLTSSSKYLFRSKPGTHKLIIHTLPMPPEEANYGDEKRYHFYARRWAVLVAQQYYPDLTRDEAVKRLSAELEELRNEIGDTQFKFSQITRRQECFLGTDSDRLATYIRKLIAMRKGEFAQVYEANPRARIVVGDETFPDTETGRRLAHAYAAEKGISEIKVLKE